MEKFPGAESKIDEYVQRIQNGEDKEFVLQGLGSAFRDPIEAKLAESSGPAPIAHKESDWADDEHQMGIDIYNTFANIGNGMAKGLRENFDPKIAQYVADIKSGQSKEYVLGGAPKSMVDAVEKELAKEQNGSLEKVTGIEAIQAKILAIAETHYIWTHQTDEAAAKNIFESNFEVSPGAGIASTMTWESGKGAVNQIERQLDGDAHRNAKGMFILAVPKSLFSEGAPRSKTDALENMLLESRDYGKDGNPNLVIPKEYNFGYLQGEDLYIHKSFL